MQHKYTDSADDDYDVRQVDTEVRPRRVSDDDELCIAPHDKYLVADCKYVLIWQTIDYRPIVPFLRRKLADNQT